MCSNHSLGSQSNNFVVASDEILNNTLKRKILEVTIDFEETVASHIKQDNFCSAQVNESTDISDKASCIL